MPNRYCHWRLDGVSGLRLPSLRLLTGEKIRLLAIPYPPYEIHHNMIDASMHILWSRPTRGLLT